MDGGIPPGINIRISLQPSSNEFRIMRFPPDAQKYKLVIENLSIHVPVGHLTEATSILIKKKLSNEPFQLQYRHLSCTNIPIPIHSMSFSHDNVFPRTNVFPCRLYVAFVVSSSFHGNYNQNPFEFRRFWRKLPGRNDILDDHGDFVVLRPSHEQPHQGAPTSHPTSRLTAAVKAAATSLGLGSSDADRSIEENLGQQQNERDDPPNPPGPPQPEEINWFDNYGDPSVCAIEDISLTINGHLIDSLHESSDPNDDMMNYKRMQLFCGYEDTPFTNSISYDDFKSSFFVAIWDLSTNQNSLLADIAPTSRVGRPRLSVRFSAPTPDNLVMLLFCENPKTMVISKTGKVGFNYTPSGTQ